MGEVLTVGSVDDARAWGVRLFLGRDGTLHYTVGTRPPYLFVANTHVEITPAASLLCQEALEY